MISTKAGLLNVDGELISLFTLAEREISPQVLPSSLFTLSFYLELSRLSHLTSRDLA